MLLMMLLMIMMVLMVLIQQKRTPNVVKNAVSTYWYEYIENYQHLAKDTNTNNNNNNNNKMNHGVPIIHHHLPFKPKFVKRY
jgi:hypothetical protein